jgi:hypothetical protein
MRFVWAAYKKGALEDMGGSFALPNMDAEAFKLAFEEVSARFSEAWTIWAPTKRGFIAVGIVFSAFAPSLPYRVIGGIAWFPWASKRNVIEGTVAFFSGARREVPTVAYAIDEHKRVYEVCCMHGVMRRVGTSHVVFPGKSAAVYETRAPQ